MNNGDPQAASATVRPNALAPDRHLTIRSMDPCIYHTKYRSVWGGARVSIRNTTTPLVNQVAVVAGRTLLIFSTSTNPTVSCAFCQ